MKKKSSQLSFSFDEADPEKYIDAQIEILLDPASDDLKIVDAILASEKYLTKMTPFQYAEFVLCFTKFFLQFVHVKSVFKDVMWKIFHKITGDHLKEEGVI